MVNHVFWSHGCWCVRRHGPERNGLREPYRDRQMVESSGSPTQSGATLPSRPDGKPPFDIEELKVPPRSIVVAGILLLVFANYMTWMDVDIEADGFSYEGKLKGGSSDDTRDVIDNAGLLFYLSLLGAVAICLRRAFVGARIGEGNYSQLVMILGAVLLLLAWSCYSEIKEQVDDNDSADIGYGLYLALVGPVLVLFGGYQLYQEDQEGGAEDTVSKPKTAPTKPSSPVEEIGMTPQLDQVPDDLAELVSEPPPPQSPEGKEIPAAEVEKEEITEGKKDVLEGEESKEAEVKAEIITETKEQEDAIVDNDSLYARPITENSYLPGTIVSHSKFGKGTVISSNPDEEHFRLEIEFADGKKRTLISSFVVSPDN